MDQIHVEVFETIDGVTESLGTRTADIEVTQGRRHTIFGSGRGKAWRERNGDWCGSGGGFYTYHPKVKDAIRYDVHCYGFNDTAYYGQHRWYSISPSSATEVNGEYEVGWFGSAGFGPCGNSLPSDWVSNAQEDADGYTNSWRIAGLIVEITVIYPDGP
jgi:hypothetical protein